MLPALCDARGSYRARRSMLEEGYRWIDAAFVISSMNSPR